MFNLFKRKKSIVDSLDLSVLEGFKKIRNSDSLQYVNQDETKVVYLSVLKVTGSDVFSISSIKPTVIEDANGWQLKAAKKLENELLVCVISVVRQDDIEWAKIVFDSIDLVK